MKTLNEEHMKGDVFMDRLPVDSTNLSSVGYDPQNKVLEIEFKNGNIYQYFSVPENINLGLISASSAGKYFNSNIKDIYRYTQVK